MNFELATKVERYNTQSILFIFNFTSGDHILPLCVVPDYVPHYQEIGLIQAYKAPVLLDSFYKYVYEQWDLTTLRVSLKRV